jgi:predicted transcriptional regulator
LYSKDLGFATFGQNDHCIIFRLFTITGGIEYKHHIFFGQEALEWGKDFFDYYLKDSTPITEL